METNQPCEFSCCGGLWTSNRTSDGTYRRPLSLVEMPRAATVESSLSPHIRCT